MPADELERAERYAESALAPATRRALVEKHPPA
jgi:hypothetical protein